MTLKRFDTDKHVHLFDGGNADNLGLSAVCRMFDTMEQRTPADKSDKSPCTNSAPQAMSVSAKRGIPPRVIVVLVDAHTGKSGVDSSRRDSRRFFDFIVDSNFLDASENLLAANRKQTLRYFRTRFEQLLEEGNGRSGHTLFYHLKFADLEDSELRARVDNIPTNFKINDSDTQAIDVADTRLLSGDNPCLGGIRTILTGGTCTGDTFCSYSH
jgi:hypothetical protein